MSKPLKSLNPQTREAVMNELTMILCPFRSEIEMKPNMKFSKRVELINDTADLILKKLSHNLIYKK